MSDISSEESVDEVQLEFDMLVQDCEELLNQLNAQKTTQSYGSMNNFEQQFEAMMKEKKRLEDQISDNKHEINYKQNQMEMCQAQLLVTKEQIRTAQQSLKEKEDLVKMLSKQLKEM
ncbi:hypothetical protein pb186bvf_015344 [Paramecium bursaria]